MKINITDYRNLIASKGLSAFHLLFQNLYKDTENNSLFKIEHLFFFFLIR